MHDQDTVRIPLRARDGSIRAYAVVDANDAPQMIAYRWHRTSQGYAGRMAQINGRRHVLLLHRQLLGLKAGDRLEVDHIDRDKLNCRRNNMRLATRGQNGQNLPQGRGRSEHRGVSWIARIDRWFAYTTVNGKRHSLGYFASEIEAAGAAYAARRRLMPYAVD